MTKDTKKLNLSDLSSFYWFYFYKLLGVNSKTVSGQLPDGHFPEQTHPRRTFPQPDNFFLFLIRLKHLLYLTKNWQLLWVNYMSDAFWLKSIRISLPNLNYDGFWTLFGQLDGWNIIIQWITFIITLPLTK